VEQGTPSSLVEALEQIRSRAPETERVFVQVAASLLAGVYPDVPVPVLPPEAPSVYARILRDAERGVYVRPASSSQDFLEHVLPFLAFFHGGKTAIRNSLADLDKAAILNPKSALPPLLRGIACERSGDAAAAGEAFTLALALGADYQAELGLARLQHNSGDYDAELGRLVRLQNRYPQYISIKRQLALVYAQRGDNARAGALAAEVLARNPRDGEFLLLHARVLIDQGLFNQALAPLEAYAPIDSGGRQYLFLRARVQAEGYRNPDAALGYLRTLLRANAGDEEAAVYMAALLLESNKAEENAEGRSLLSRFLNRASIPPPVLALAVADSVRRESWREAKTYLDRLLVQSRSAANLLNAYKVERGLGNNAQALIYARELYNLEGNNNEEAVNAYVTALIETGRQSDAGRIIEQRLAAVSGGVLKSRYYYLRSRLRDGDDAIMNDLRSALFEDPRNVDALIAMFEIYHRRQDQRRAVYYLKQAVALAPGNAVLRRYEAEYRAALGTSY
jgi:tetratricopeptide (TPR) repeat protein